MRPFTDEGQDLVAELLAILDYFGYFHRARACADNGVEALTGQFLADFGAQAPPGQPIDQQQEGVQDDEDRQEGTAAHIAELQQVEPKRQPGSGDDGLPPGAL